MPYLSKKGGKNDEKVFVGQPQQHNNMMDNYLIRPPAVAAIVNNARPSNSRGPIINQIVAHAQEKFQSNRFGALRPVYLDGGPKKSAADLVKSVLPNPMPVQKRREPESTKGNKMGEIVLKFPTYATGYRTTSESDDSCKTKRWSSDETSEGSTTPKPDIISYYKARGMDYFEERKKHRQYVSRRPSEFSPMTDKERLAGGIVFWDEYSPPAGYTLKDLEGIPIPEDPIPESPKGVQISPCVLKAANLRLRPSTPISPDPSSQNVRDILEQLESIGANRAQWKEERRKRKEERRKRKQALVQNMEIGNSNPVMEINESSGREVLPEPSGNEEFPNDEDSFVQRATQLEERNILTAKNQNKTSGLNVESETFLNLSTNKQIGGNTPVSSTGRLSRPIKSNCRLSGLFSSHKRPQTGKLDFSSAFSESPSKKSATTSPDSGESIFETSKMDTSTSEGIRPMNSSKVVIGDFVDDDDDDVFSQMPMPVLPEQRPGKTIPVNEKSTVIVSANSSASDSNSAFGDSLLTADVLLAMEQWEEKAIGAGAHAKVYTSTPMQNPNNASMLSPISGIRRSARIKTNDLSSIRETPKSSTINESTGKPKTSSRLSRSFVRSRK